ncbi:hypothetical protein EMPS_00280 [Entomortierella parvispora]|uniref:Uncharacterized protein n=1 Tax=Entomortierella parvispora TaxID=205924 RepID=A0A9P3H086_9FUNG|nr:hypothetical protein EMPS_00280 [Entomortierella parvispora]
MDTSPQPVAAVDSEGLDNDARVPESPPSSPLPLNFGIRHSIGTDQGSETNRRQGPLTTSLSKQPAAGKTGNIRNTKSPSRSTLTAATGAASTPTAMKGRTRPPTVIDSRPRFTLSTVVQPRQRIYGLGPSVPASPSFSPSAASPSATVNARTPSPVTRAKTAQKCSTSYTVKESRINPKVRSTAASSSPDISTLSKPTTFSSNKFSKSRVTTTTTTTTRVASKTVTTAIRTEKNSTSRKAPATPITTTTKITTTTTGAKAKDLGTKKRLTASATAGCQSGAMLPKAGSLVTKEIATTLQPLSTPIKTPTSERKNVHPSSSLSALKITPTMTVGWTRTNTSDELVGDTSSTIIPSSSSEAEKLPLQQTTTRLLPALDVDGPAQESLTKDFGNVLLADVLPQIKTESPKPECSAAQRQFSSTNQKQTSLPSPSPHVLHSCAGMQRGTYAPDGAALTLCHSFKPTTQFTTPISGERKDPFVVTNGFQDDEISTVVGNLAIQEATDSMETNGYIDKKSCRTQETRQLDRVSIRAAMGIRPAESPLLRVRDPKALNCLLKVMKDRRDAAGLDQTKASPIDNDTHKDTLSPPTRPTPVVHTFLSRRSRAKATFEVLNPQSSAAIPQQCHIPDNPAPITFMSKRTYMRLQAEKRRATIDAVPSRDILLSWTTAPPKHYPASSAAVPYSISIDSILLILDIWTLPTTDTANTHHDWTIYAFLPKNFPRNQRSNSYCRYCHPT